MTKPHETRCRGALAVIRPGGRGAAAQEFPARPVQLMVAFPAGGSTDVGARIVAAIAEKELGQPMWW